MLIACSGTVTVKEILELFAEHVEGKTTCDLSIVVTATDALSLLESGIADMHIETHSYMEDDSEYIIISSIVSKEDRTRVLFIEDAYNSEGKLKTHESDVLIIPNYLPQDIKEHLLSCESTDYIQLTLI